MATIVARDPLRRACRCQQPALLRGRRARKQLPEIDRRHRPGGREVEHLAGQAAHRAHAARFVERDDAGERRAEPARIELHLQQMAVAQHRIEPLFGGQRCVPE
ncbi:hypothetical protein QZM43_01025 [Burkholderia orbicola]|uniref:hypothetical protein n=1 Tax=Burkholderia cenocepacia TaxID=95486 RepID=UPI0020124E7C|nr:MULTISPECIES: hypothetical protein [Burkholderia cepacia complex]MDN7468634.1 hypothetical protein [Burkholderia orbicola]MDN7501291.1 hypothetical protein [Burkholderia orbicola]